MKQKNRVYSINCCSTFRKWGRKGYSIFQSLKKEVRIGSLAVAYLIIALPVNAEKRTIVLQPDSINSLNNVAIDDVVVSAQRSPVAFEQTARIVTVISHEEIQKAPVQSMQDLLEFAAGVDVRQRGNNGVQADISIRGSTFDQVLILLNGININDPQTGHHNLNLPVSLDAIQRIEILEGPASRTHGINAFSGSINIITDSYEKSSMKIRLVGGQFGTFNGGLTSNINSKKVKNIFSIEHLKSDGYIANTDYKLTNTFYQGKFTDDFGKLEWQIGFSDVGFGANSFYTPAYPNQFEQIKTLFSSVKMETGSIIHFSPSIYLRHKSDRFELFRDNVNAPTWYKSHNYHLTDCYGINLNSWFESNFGKSSVGADFRSENIWSTVLGKPIAEPINIPGEPNIQFQYSDSRTNFSLFVEQSKTWQKFSISGGFMANWNSYLGRNWSIHPGIDLSWSFASKWRYYTSINQSLRLPTFTDLYYKSATNIGNSNLLPENAIAYESGFKYNSHKIKFNATYFRRWGTNMIDWMRKPNETIWHAKNITKLTTDGLEFDFQAFPAEISNQLKFIHKLSISYSYMNQNKQSGEYISMYVLDYLKHKIDLRIDHQLFKNISINWLFSYQDRNGTYTQWIGKSYGKEVDYQPFWLVDAQINWKLRYFDFFAETTNLLNANYYDYGNVAQPGRWLKAGIIFRPKIF